MTQELIISHFRSKRGAPNKRPHIWIILKRNKRSHNFTERLEFQHSSRRKRKMEVIKKIWSLQKKTN